MRVAIKTAVQTQTAVQVDGERRQMEAREAAFRRLVKANARTNKKNSEQNKEHKEKKQKGKNKNQKGEQKRHTTQRDSKGSEVENADPLRYVKKAEEIRYREPKIPW